MAAPIRLRPPAIGAPVIYGTADAPAGAGRSSGRRPLSTIVGTPRGQSRRSIRGFQYHYDDIVQVNPVLEQPKLIFYSLAQPIIRWGHRRFVRAATDGGLHGMRAGPRFLGRWAYVGVQMAQFRDRGKTAGVMGRPFTYRVPPWTSASPAARTVDLGTISYAYAGMPSDTGTGGPTAVAGTRGLRYDVLGQPTPNVAGYPTVPGPVVIRGGSRAPAMGR